MSNRNNAESWLYFATGVVITLALSKLWTEQQRLVSKKKKKGGGGVSDRDNGTCTLLPSFGFMGGLLWFDVPVGVSG